MATISRGIKAPIIREGDDIVSIVCDCVLSASKEQGFTLRDRDVVAVTEAVVARAAGNYATIDAIAEDVRRKLGGNTVGLVFPILSRNRFAICLRGIARGARKVVVQLGYPSDEVGNHLVDIDALDDSGIDPYKDVLTIAEFRRHFGTPLHPFTGVDYISYYTQLIEEEGAEAEIILANRPEAILSYSDKVLCCDTHTRFRTQRRILAAGAAVRYTQRPGKRQRLQRKIRPSRFQQSHRGRGKALPQQRSGGGRGYKRAPLRRNRQKDRGYGIWRRCL